MTRLAGGLNKPLPSNLPHAVTIEVATPFPFKSSSAESYRLAAREIRMWAKENYTTRVRMRFNFKTIFADFNAAMAALDRNDRAEAFRIMNTQRLRVTVHSDDAVFLTYLKLGMS